MCAGQARKEPQWDPGWDKDKWEFYQDRRCFWRWRRAAPNGNIVGAACQGYRTRNDCEANALRNGWPGKERCSGQVKETP